LKPVLTFSKCTAINSCDTEEEGGEGEGEAEEEEEEEAENSQHIPEIYPHCPHHRL
jgi:hypothetical protein